MVSKNVRAVERPNLGSISETRNASHFQQPSRPHSIILNLQTNAVEGPYFDPTILPHASADTRIWRLPASDSTKI